MYSSFKQREQVYTEAVRLSKDNAQDIFNELETHNPGMNEIHKTESGNSVIFTIYVYTRYGKMRMCNGDYLLKREQKNKVYFSVMSQSDLNDRYDMVSKPTYSELSERVMDGTWIYSHGGD